LRSVRAHLLHRSRRPLAGPRVLTARDGPAGVRQTADRRSRFGKRFPGNLLKCQNLTAKGVGSMRRRRSRALAVLAVLGCLAGGAAGIPAAVGPQRPAGAAADPPQAAGAAAHESADCAPDPAVPKRQLRAMWIASVTNIDWPSQPGLSADEQKQEFLDWLD